MLCRGKFGPLLVCGLCNLAVWWTFGGQYFTFWKFLMLFCCILYVMAVYFVLYIIKSVSLVLSFANVFFFPVFIYQILVIFLFLLFLNRKMIHVKHAEKVGIFSAVKHVLMLTIPSVCFHRWKLLFLATGGALNVYDSISGTVIVCIKWSTDGVRLVIADNENVISLQVSPLNDIEKILDCEMRPTVADDSDASKLGSKQIFVKQYLVKWKGLSYLHCTW